MHRHDVRLGQQVLKGGETVRAFRSHSRRVVLEYLESEDAGDSLYKPAHVSDSHYAHGHAFQRQSLAGSHTVQGGEDIVHDSPGVAAGSVGHHDALRIAVAEIYVVGSDGRRGDESD